MTEKMSIWETGLKIYLFVEKFKKSCSWQFLYLDNLMQDDWCALKESVKGEDEAAGQNRGPVGTRAELLKATSFCKRHH